MRQHKPKAKYNNKPITTNDGKFDSYGEYRYWLKLNQQRNAVNPSERITNIERQKTFRFVVNGVLICKYVADFVIQYANGNEEIHDFKNPYLITGKGKSTPAASVFRYKQKLMQALYNKQIIVINGANCK